VIYKLSSPWTTWTSVHTISIMNSNSGYAFHSGLHVVDVSGTPTMVCLYMNTSNFTGSSVSSDGSSWTDTNEGGPFPYVPASADFSRSFVYRNTIFWGSNYNGINTLMVQFDPSTGALTSYTTIGGTNSPPPATGAMCVFENELYFACYNSWNSSAIPILWKLSGGAWAQASTIGQAINGHNIRAGSLACSDASSGFALFVDGGKLYALFPAAHNTGSNIGTYCYEFDSTLTQTEVTNTVLPASERNTDTGGSLSGTGGGNFRWYVAIDNDSDPENPAVYLWKLSNDSGGSWNYWEWNGPSSVITSGSSAGSTGLAMPAMPQGGGDRWWSANELNIELVGTAAVLGGMQLSFKCYGDPGSSDKTVKLWVAPDEESPRYQCVLTGAVTGGSAVRNGNQVDNVDADDGVTTYTCIWNFGGQTPSVSGGDSIVLMATIEV
jgi:hypothetical protein